MIDKTYVINLARRTDKKQHMDGEFAKLKSNGIELNHTYFDAIDGSNSDILSKYQFNIPKWFDPNSGKAMTNGEVGCALSHCLIWKDIVEQVESKVLEENCKVLVLEDDVIFLDGFMDKFNRYTSETTFEYDMLYVHRKPLNLEAETKLSLHINKVRKSYWTCAYVITYAGAKKLVNSNYINNLIPVDEFLPIMYGCVVDGFNNLFDTCEKINCYAVTPSLLKLTGTAFYDSETFHSESYIKNDEFTFGEGKRFTILYVGPTDGDEFDRFVHYCKLYALPCIIRKNDEIGAETKIIKTELDSWTKEQIDSTLLLVLTVSPIDFCTIIPISSPAEIVDKFIGLAKEDESVVVPSYDKDNKKVIFCAWAKTIIGILDQFYDKMEIDSSDGSTDGQLQMMLTINSLINNSNVSDEKNEIYQILHGDTSINFNHRSSRISSEKTGSSSCIIVSNDTMGNILLNKVENYTGNGWNEYYGYSVPNTSYVPKHKVYLSFSMGSNNNVLQILSSLNYPKHLLTIVLNRAEGQAKLGEMMFSSEDDLREMDLQKFLKSDCDYYFFIDKNCVLTNPDILIDFISLDKSIVAPLLRKGSESWSNFWGDIVESGYYKRSFDYFDILDGGRQGCWNVPYVTGTYLIKRSVVEKVPFMFSKYRNNIDLDMRFCQNLRESCAFMYVNNLKKYGYLEDVVESTAVITSPVSTAEVKLDDILTRRDEWEKKYLHPHYYEHRATLQKINYIEVCNDIYTFPLFSETFCKELIDRTESYGKWSKGKDQHADPRLGSNYYENVPTVDVQLFEVALEKQWETIVFSYIAPVVKHLYNNYKTKDINLAFVVRYKAEEQSSLSPHHDASSYTVNIALNRGNGIDYDGGGCRFIRQNYVLKNQLPGMCCVHSGRLTSYHEGLPVNSGTRYILVSFIN